jgi:predicted TIM-barrel fold metal-dependent hydrolase
MRTITLEEHFLTQSFLKAVHGDRPVPTPIARLQPRLLDIGDGRIAAMDEGGISMQVLSLASMGFDALDSAAATSLAHDVNNELAAAVRANPTRLAGFAMLNLKDPSAAAKELERCITQLGFVGALVDGTIAVEGANPPSLFLDDPRFTPFWDAAAQLGCPVYLHPAPPPEAVRDAYYSGLPGERGADLGFLLSIAGWGWHSETAIHSLRLIVSGLFDRHPGLQLIIGHMGEMLPMALARTSAVLSNAATHLQRPVAEYFQSNIHVTTSGYFTQPPLRCALDVLGIDRLLFSVDYPFSATTQGRGFLHDAAEWLSEEDMAKLAHGNAERLLKLDRAG